MEDNEILEEYMMMIHRIANSFDELTTIEELEEMIDEMENVMMEAESDDDISHEEYEELSELVDGIVDEFYDELLNLKKKNMEESKKITAKKIIRLTEADLNRLVKRVLREQQTGIVGSPRGIQDMMKKFPQAKEIMQDCADELRLNLVKKLFNPDSQMGVMSAILDLMNPFAGNPMKQLESEIKQITACVTKKSPELAKLLNPVVRY